jgi:NAD+ diphosphatase
MRSKKLLTFNPISVIKSFMKNKFKFCPQCGAHGSIEIQNDKRLSCSKCGLVYFQNVASAVAVIIEADGKFVFIVRNKDPQKGKLDLPGGFVDPMEKAEEALKRECFEELGINLTNFEYLTSFPNIYDYKGVRYYTCDLFFKSKISDLNFKIDKVEIMDVKIIEKDKINLEDMAFESVKKFLTQVFKLK